MWPTPYHLLEAIALAGDLKPTSRFDRIAVIPRVWRPTAASFSHDIRSKDLFTSPCYYLQQNDIVYVEPNGTKAAEQSQRNFNLWRHGYLVHHHVDTR
jgi:polysaccharide export outer membrane protein